MFLSFTYTSAKRPIYSWSLRLILLGLLGLPFSDATQERVGLGLIESLEKAKQAVDADPTSSDARLNLGLAYLELGSMGKAKAEFESVVRLDPYAPSGYYWLGGVYFLQARYEEAIDVFKRALEKLPEWSVAYHALGMSNFERHNHNAAEIAFNKALELMENAESPRYDVPASPFGTGGYGWSAKLSAANVYYFLGLLASHGGSLDKAKAYWRQAIEVGPPLAEVYFELGVAYNKDGQWEDAMRSLRSAIHLRPEMPAARYQLARAYLKLGRTTEGDRELGEFRRLKTTYDQISAQHTMIRQAPDAAVTLFRLARKYMRDKKYAEASREFQKAIWHNPDMAEAHSGLGHAYFGMGRLNDALDAQLKALELEPNMAEAHVAKGLILLQRAEKTQTKTDYEEALAACRKGIELNPDLQVPLLIRTALGKTYLMENKVPQASRQFEEILKVDPKYADAYYYLGVIRARQRDYESAEEAYSRAINLAPASAKAYERLAHLYGVRGIHIDKAIQLARKAVDLEPNSPACLNTLSWLHYLNKDYEKAITALKKALALQPDNHLYSEGLKVIQQARQAENASKKGGK